MKRQVLSPFATQLISLASNSNPKASLHQPAEYPAEKKHIA